MTRKYPPRSRLLVAGTCIAVGCLLTVLSSWGIAVGVRPARAGMFSHDPPHWPITPPSDWASDPVCYIPGPKTALNGWELYQGTKPSVADLAKPSVINTLCEMEIVRTGSPFHALAMANLTERDSSTATKSVKPVWQLQVPTFTSRDVHLPLLPLWPGFAFNTLFYAALAWGVWQLPLALRRRRRRGKGQCPSCGYDRTGIAVGTPCPECGRA